MPTRKKEDESYGHNKSPRGDVIAEGDVGIAVVVLPREGGDDFVSTTLFDDVCDRVEILEAVHELLCLESLR